MASGTNVFNLEIDNSGAYTYTVENQLCDGVY